MITNLKITRTGQGIPLVFIHGWGLNSGIWEPTAEKLSTNFQIITIDLPGYGTNLTNTVSPYCLAGIAKQIVASINKPAVYVGWSLGGLFATHIAAEFQDQVLGLITVASSPFFVEEGVENSAKQTKQINNTNKVNWPGIKAPVLNAFHQQLAVDTKKTINGFLKIQAMGSPKIRQDIKEIQSLIFQYDMPSTQTLAQSLSLLETVDLRNALTKINVPLLRLYGRLDSLVPKAVIPLVNELVKNAGFSDDTYTFEHASHAPFISHADEFYQVVHRWVTEKI